MSRRSTDGPHTMPRARFAALRARLTLPTGLEAYWASGWATVVHAPTATTQGTAGSEGPCRVCLRRLFPGDRVLMVKLRRVGTTRAGATLALVHQACETGPRCLCLTESAHCPRFTVEGTGEELHVLACPTCGDHYFGQLPARPCADCASIIEARSRRSPPTGASLDALRAHMDAEEARGRPRSLRQWDKANRGGAR